MPNGDIIRQNINVQSDGTKWITFKGKAYIVEYLETRRVSSCSKITHDIYKCIGEAIMSVQQQLKIEEV